MSKNLLRSISNNETTIPEKKKEPPKKKGHHDDDKPKMTHVFFNLKQELQRLKRNSFQEVDN